MEPEECAAGYYQDVIGQSSCKVITDDIYDMI
jgi:hypothetical protein